MEGLRRWSSRIDALLEYLGIGFLAATVLIVTWRVLSRALLGSAPPWTEQVSVLLMIWLVFLGIAIGFRERDHAAVKMFVARLPEGTQRWAQRLAYALVFAFGLYLIVRGLQLILQSEESALYVAMPISGLMVCAYTALQVLGVRTEKSRNEEGDEEFPERRAE